MAFRNERALAHCPFKETTAPPIQRQPQSSLRAQPSMATVPRLRGAMTLVGEKSSKLIPSKRTSPLGCAEPQKTIARLRQRRHRIVRELSSDCHGRANHADGGRAGREAQSTANKKPARLNEEKRGGGTRTAHTDFRSARQAGAIKTNAQKKGVHAPAAHTTVTVIEKNESCCSL